MSLPFLGTIPWLEHSYAQWLVVCLLPILLVVIVVVAMRARRLPKSAEGPQAANRYAIESARNDALVAGLPQEHPAGPVRDSSLLLSSPDDVTISIPTSWQPSPVPAAPVPWTTPEPAEGAAAVPRLHLFVDEETPDSVVRMARTAMATGMPERAAELLAPLHGRTDLPTRLLMAMGGILQDIADKLADDSESYGHAADAFTQVLAREPQRQALQRRIGQCRLKQAQRLSSGAQRSALFNEAAERLGQAAETNGPDARLLAEWGTAQAQCAALDMDQGTTAYLNAIVPLRAAMQAGADVDSDAAWQLQHVLRQSALAERADHRDPRFAEAASMIARALDAGAHVARRPLWQATAIEAELESMRVENPHAAARRTHLREMRTRFASAMNATSAPVLACAWAELLSAEAEGMVGKAAIEKYQEAESLISGAMREHGENVDLAISAARIARRKGARQIPLARLATLRNAQRILKPHMDRFASEELQFEAATNAMEQAPLLRLQASEEMYARALEWADPLVHSPLHERKAMQYCLEAASALGLAGDHEVMADRLLARASGDTDALMAVARYSLKSQCLARAAEACEAAWRQGAPKAMLLPLWQDVLDAAMASAPGPDWLEGSRRHLLQASRGDTHTAGVRQPRRAVPGG